MEQKTTKMIKSILEEAKEYCKDQGIVLYRFISDAVKEKLEKVKSD